MKALPALLLALAVLVTPASAIDYAKSAQMSLRDLEKQVAEAKEKTDARYAWQVCEVTLKQLEGNVAELPAPDRAPYLAKIKELKPVIAAGSARNRAGIVARRISDTLDSAREDLAAGRNPSGYFERLDGYFAEEDLKALPADELKKLQADYTEVKKRAAK